MQRLTRVDCSAFSYLAQCRCGWRDGPTLTRREAERLTDWHLDRAHPGACADTAARRQRARRQLHAIRPDTYVSAGGRIG
jgi:hypothetical protein